MNDSAGRCKFIRLCFDGAKKSFNVWSDIFLLRYVLLVYLYNLFLPLDHNVFMGSWPAESIKYCR